MVRLPLHSRDAPVNATLSLNRPFSIVCNETEKRIATELNREELARVGQPARMYLKYRLAGETSQRAGTKDYVPRILNTVYCCSRKSEIGISWFSAIASPSKSSCVSCQFSDLCVWHTNCSQRTVRSSLIPRETTS